MIAWLILLICEEHARLSVVTLHRLFQLKSQSCFNFRELAATSGPSLPGLPPYLMTPFNVCEYIVVVPVSVRNTGDPEISSTVLFHYLPTKVSAAPLAKSKYLKRAKSGIEPQTAPVCRTLFNKAPAVRHGRLNPPHSNIRQPKDFNTSVGQCHQAKTD